MQHVRRGLVTLCANCHRVAPSECLLDDAANDVENSELSTDGCGESTLHRSAPAVAWDWDCESATGSVRQGLGLGRGRGRGLGLGLDRGVGTTVGRWEWHVKEGPRCTMHNVLLQYYCTERSNTQ